MLSYLISDLGDIIQKRLRERKYMYRKYQINSNLRHSCLQNIYIYICIYNDVVMF